MPKAPKCVIAGVCFYSAQALKNHVRTVRDAAQLHEVITDPVVLALLRNYSPEWEQKTQKGSTIWIDWHKHGYCKPKKELMIRHDDGSGSTDISFIYAAERACAGPKDPTKEHLKDFRKAARMLIEDQVATLRKPGLQVDHVAPFTFEVLLRDWIVAESLCVSDVAVASSDGAAQRWWFADQELGERWQLFHREHAKLEAVTKEQHAKRPKIKVDWQPLL